MGAGEIRAGKAFVEVYTKDSTKGGLDGIKAKLGAFGSQVAKIGGIAVTAATAAITASVMKAVSTGANIQDLADRYAIGTTAIQQLSFAAGQSGTSLEAMVAGIKNMQKGLGNGTLGDELKAVGLSMEKLRGLSPERQFEMIGDAIGSVADPAQRTALAMKVFGKAGTDLIPVLGNVKSLSAEFDQLGITMSEGAIKEAAAFDDQLQKLSTQFNGLVVAIGSKLIPVVQDLIDRINSIVPKAKLAIASPSGLPTRILQQQAALQPRTALGQFMASLAPRLAAANAASKAFTLADKIKDAQEAMQSMLLNVGIGRPQMRGENIAALPGQALSNIYKYLSGSAASKPDAASFGTFDKRDVAGGAFLQATGQQLAELKAIKRELEEANRRRQGIQWG